MKITKEYLQNFINKISGKPELFERWCRRYNQNKYFNNIDFSYLDFSLNFYNFNFSGSDFSGSDFSRSDFSGSNFSRSIFFESDFSGSDFSRSDFSGSNFSGSIFFESNFSGSIFFESNFSESNFAGSIFAGSDFSESNFAESNFARSNFLGSDFSGSNFSGSIFFGSIFFGSIFLGSDFSGSKIKAFLKLYVSEKTKLKKIKIKKEGNYYIAYKSFGENYDSLKKWNIKEKSKIKVSRIDKNIFSDCAFGINVATIDWCIVNCNKNIWRVKIPIDTEICVPINSNGKFRVKECILDKIEVINE